MKKSIKYAGIAAATLLAVAPVAAPVVSTTTAQAATNATTDQSEQTKNVNTWLDQFADTTASKLSTNDATSTTGLITPNEAESLATFDTNNAGLVAVGSGKTTDAVKDMINSKADASVTVTATSGSTSLTTSNDIQKYLKDNTKPEVDFTITLTWYNLKGVKQTDTATVKATRPETGSELTQLNASFTTPVTVPLNSTVTNTQLTGTTGMSLSDQNGDGVFTGSIAVSPNYYSTFADAMSNAEGTDAKKLGNIKKNADGVDAFVKAGTYYQAITFNASDNTQLSQFISQYKADPSTYSVYVNGKVAAPGYDFTSAEANTTSGSEAPASITFVRTVKVSNDTSDWTVTANKGVVTTKSDNNYYTLKNDDNETISNRALAKNSAWITDQKRVDQDGNTQYRVATGEWIDANDVTFSDKATTDEGEYTDVQALNGKVTLDGPSSFIYMLYNDNGETVSNRALAGDSAWYTDKKATNAAGVTVYHVATGEWVQAGSGVNYVAY